MNEATHCACHGRPWKDCPVFGPLLLEETQQLQIGSGPIDIPSAAKETTTMTTKKKAGPKSKTKPVHRHTEEREVRVALEDPERREEILQSMLGHMKDENELALEAKEVATGYRKKLKDLAKTIEGESLDLKQGLPEQRLVEITRDFSSNTLTVKDVETGKVYEKRAMTDDDAQLPISDLPNAEEPADEDHDSDPNYDRD